MIDNQLPKRGRPRSLPTHITLPAVYRERLEHLSVERGLSLSDLIRRALDAVFSTSDFDGGDHDERHQK